jgi:RNA polymerase primary sigma factor
MSSNSTGKTKTSKVASDKVAVNPMTISRMYMNDICKISLLSREEEIELATQIHGDDPKQMELARIRLIKANLRLVVKIAHEFLNRGVPKYDLISEGNIGLMTAVEKFDPEKGVRFSSYATWWIKQAMRKALADQSRTIRVPVQAAEIIYKIKNIQTEMSKKLGRKPSDAEIAEALELSPRTVSSLRHVDLHTLSLHTPIKDGEDNEFQDTIPADGKMRPDHLMGEADSASRLREMLVKLKDRERMVIEKRFGLDGGSEKTLEEIGVELGCSRERVRQIQNKALAKLRSMQGGNRY